MEVGANVRDVKRTIEAHLRISHSFLDSRADYGGSDLIRDVSHLEYICACLGLDKERKLFKLINEMRINKMESWCKKSYTA